ncbi:MAG: hypothetical protein GKR89_33805 [Candidatus Latescibacteria bacterium]|nr:hypothetical protein [Candidatus Latescibacterota bacterium]
MAIMRWVLAAAVLGGGAGVAAEEALVLGLDECIARALEHNPQMVQGHIGVDLARIQVGNARNAFLPSVSASYGFSRRISGPRQGSFIDPDTGLLITSLGESEGSGSQSTGANFNMPLYNMGNWANLSASKHGLRGAQWDQEVNRRTVTLQIKQAYFALLQAGKLLEVQREQVRVLQEDLRGTETLFEIRAVPRSDVLASRANLESARVTEIERENSLALARSDLAFAMGLYADVRVEPRAEEFTVEPLLLTYEAAVERALDSHPSLQVQRAAMLQARDQLKATQYEVRHPSVSLSGGYSWSLTSEEAFQGPEDLFLKNYGYNFSVSMSVPIFNRLNTVNSIKTQKLNYRQSLEAFDQAERQLALEVKQAFLGLGQLRRSMAANEAAVQAAEESFKLAQERYSLKIGTFLERLQAQTALFEARTSQVQNVYDYQVQLAQLAQLVGE